jgi:23S rRNA pseudouridine2605 synthase
MPKPVNNSKLEPNDAPTGDRLQKILAQAGIASRRKAEEIILEGRVMVNGTVITTLGTRHDATKDHIRVDGKLLHGPEQQRYYMLNKPRGYVTTLDDPEKRPTMCGSTRWAGSTTSPKGCC